MSLLSRVKLKIFGNSGITAQFGQIGSDNAGTPTTTKNLSTIQSLSYYDNGLYSLTNSAAEPPRIEDLNSLYYLITSEIAYLFQQGIPEWETNTEYYIGSYVTVSGVIYKSLTGTNGSPNISKNPTTQTNDWMNVFANLNASNLAFGTIPDARFPDTLPAISGANLTNLTAGNLTGYFNNISIKTAAQSKIELIKSNGLDGFALGRSIFADDAQDFFIYDIGQGAARLTIDSAGVVTTGIHTILSATQSKVVLDRADGVAGYSIGRSVAAGNAQDFYIYDEISGATRLAIDSSGIVTTGVHKIVHATQSYLGLMKADGNFGFVIGRSTANTNLQDFFIYDAVAAVNRLTISSSGVVTCNGGGITNLTAGNLTGYYNNISIKTAAQSKIELTKSNGLDGFALGRSIFADDAQDFFIYDMGHAAVRLAIDSAGSVTMNSGATNDLGGSISSTGTLTSVTNTQSRQVNASEECTVSVGFSQINASRLCTVLTAGRSMINASYHCSNPKDSSQITSSRYVIGAIDYSLCGGYISSGSESTANRTWEIQSNGGNMYIHGALTQSYTFSDYGEYFENYYSGVEIESGYLVTLEKGKVRKAKSGETLLGSISETCGIRSGDTPFCWKNRYLRNEFGGEVWEEIDDPDYQSKIIDPETKKKIKNPEPCKKIKVRKENPEYNPELENIPRSERKGDFSLVGLIGKVYIRIDNTITEQDQYVCSDDNGVGTLSDKETNLQVMEITTVYNKKKGYGVAKCMKS